MTRSKSTNNYDPPDHRSPDPDCPLIVRKMTTTFETDLAVLLGCGIYATIGTIDPDDNSLFMSFTSPPDNEWVFVNEIDKLIENLSKIRDTLRNLVDDGE